MTLYNYLLPLHIVAGVAALGSAAVAILTKWFDMRHQWHKISGRIYAWSMTVIFITAAPMAIIISSEFLFLVAVFSFYMNWYGWRLAIKRYGVPHMSDWIRALVMIAASVVMLGFGTYLLFNGRSVDGIVLYAFFGGIGLFVSYGDLRDLRLGGLRGRKPIAVHLAAMLGVMLTTLTAFLIRNIDLEPDFLEWILPTIIVLPLMFWWMHRVNTVGVNWVSPKTK